MIIDSIYCSLQTQHLGWKQNSVFDLINYKNRYRRDIGCEGCVVDCGF